ncbi:MAG: TonB-dependent receptor [Deltaproteobacteria bacterium]|nr:TonB-dependent receptor [Deltaproteobacteria bacterium]
MDAPVADGPLALLHEVVTAVVGMLFDPSERIYWGFLLATVVLAWAVRREQRGAGVPTTPGRVLGRSSALDLQLLIFNALVRIVGAGAWVGSAFGLSLWLVAGLDARFGVPITPTWPPAVVAAVYTVVLFVAWDASRYLLHRWLHQVPWLWELHKVHHSADTLTPLTLYRVHPLEALLFGLRGVLVTGVISAGFFYVFRRDAIELELLGVNVFGAVFSLVGANLRHSHVWWSWGRLERWLMSPAQHQLHHADDQDAGINLGTWIALWDRLGGTLRYADVRPPAAFGLPDSEANHHPGRLGSALLQPMIAAARVLGARRRRSLAAAAVVGALVWAASSLARAEPPVAAPEAGPSAKAPPSVSATPRGAPPPQAVRAPREPGDEAPPPSASSTAPTLAPTAVIEPPAPTSAAATIVPDEPAPLATDGREADTSRTVIVGSMFDGDELPRVAGSAHVIGKRELERREYDDVHRILNGVPGVYVRGEDGFGLRPNIGLRGANPDRSAKVTLMEDGVLLAPAPYAAPAAYYFPFPTRMVGVEVFKGPASIKYGPNTIGGAINLRTREIPEGHASSVDLAAGRFGYVKGHGFYGTTYRGFGVLLEVAHLQSDGFKQLDGGGDTGFAKNDAMLKLSYEGKTGRDTVHRVQLKGGYATERSNESYLGLSREDLDRTPYRRYAASQRDQMTWWRSQAELSYHVGNDTLQLETTLYRHDFHRVWRRLDRFRDEPDFSTVLANPEAGQLAVLSAIIRGEEDATTPEQALMVTRNDRRFVSEGMQTALHWRPTFGPVTQDLEIGGRFHHDGIIRNHLEDAYMMTGGVMVPDGSPTIAALRNAGEAHAVALHVLDAITLWDRFTIAPGIRVETILMRYADHLTGARAHRQDVAVTPGIGALVRALEWLDVFAGVHRGFSPVAPGQPDAVKPEYSVNYEAGVRAIRRRVWAEAVGFFSDYSNLNGACTFSSGCADGDGSTQFNGGRVFVYGLESALRYRYQFQRGVRLDVGARYTYTGTQFRHGFASPFPQWGDVQAGDQLPYVPVHLAGGSLGVGAENWEVSLAPSYNGAMRDVAGQGKIPDDQRIDGFFVLDAAANLRLHQRLLLYGTVNNATNNAYAASYRPFGLRPGAPLTFMIGIKGDIFLDRQNPRGVFARRSGGRSRGRAQRASKQRRPG